VFNHLVVAIVLTDQDRGKGKDRVNVKKALTLMRNAPRVTTTHVKVNHVNSKTRRPNFHEMTKTKIFSSLAPMRIWELKAGSMPLVTKTKAAADVNPTPQ
jgi:hypothetical protein